MSSTWLALGIKRSKQETSFVCGRFMSRNISWWTFRDGNFSRWDIFNYNGLYSVSPGLWLLTLAFVFVKRQLHNSEKVHTENGRQFFDGFKPFDFVFFTCRDSSYYGLACCTVSTVEEDMVKSNNIRYHPYPYILTQK